MLALHYRFSLYAHFCELRGSEVFRIKLGFHKYPISRVNALANDLRTSIFVLSLLMWPSVPAQDATDMPCIILFGLVSHTVTELEKVSLSLKNVRNGFSVFLCLCIWFIFSSVNLLSLGLIHVTYCIVS